MRSAQICGDLRGCRSVRALLCAASARYRSPARAGAGDGDNDVEAAMAMLLDPKRAQKDVEAGDKAAAEGRFDDALAAYDEAAKYAPQNAAIVGKGATLRSQLVRAHTDNAEQFALSGDVSKAIDELRTAMRIDPTNAIVAERMAQIDGHARRQSNRRTLLPSQVCKNSTRKPASTISTCTATRKSAYDQVTHMFGIKAAFDPDLPAHRVHLRVDDVDFTTAMSLLAQQTGTFWRPVERDI